ARQVDDAEQPHVLEREMRAALEVEDDARESRLIVRVAVVREIAGHSEVEMQPLRAGLGEEMLPMPPHARERASAERAPELLFAHGEHALVANAHARDALIERMLRKVARES